MVRDVQQGLEPHKSHWFIYSDDRHRGPYKTAHLSNAILTGAIPPTALAWCEGMPDWEPIHELEAFRDAVAAAVPGDGSSSFQDPLWTGIEETALSDMFDFLETPFEEEAASEPGLVFPLLDSLPRPPLGSAQWPDESIGQEPQPVATAAPIPPEPKSNMWKWILALTVCTAGIIAGISVYYDKTSFPALNDLSFSEMRDLKRAAQEKLGEFGPAGAIALVPGTLTDPRFYVGSNLPDGSSVEIRLEGVSETLVDTFDVRASASIVLRNGFAKSQPIRQDTGKALARGEYKVSLVSRGEVIAQRTLFLGGAKDKDYSQRLNAYHANLKSQVDAELEEIRQLTETLDKQLSDTRTRFAAGAGGWPAFHGHWLELQQQIDILFKEWTMKTLERDFYYGSLYGAVKDAAELVGRLHAHQDQYLTGTEKTKDAVSAIEREAQSAQRALLGIRAKINMAERQLPTDSGLPKRLQD